MFWKKTGFFSNKIHSEKEVSTVTDLWKNFVSHYWKKSQRGFVGVLKMEVFENFVAKGGITTLVGKILSDHAEKLPREGNVFRCF